jgi:hypothetical protein
MSKAKDSVEDLRTVVVDADIGATVLSPMGDGSGLTGIGGDTAERTVYTATASQTTFATTYDVGFVDVYLNGIKLQVTADFSDSSGTSVVLTTGATVGDIVDIIAYSTFDVANTYTPATADAKFAQVANHLSDLPSAATARTNLGLVIGTDVGYVNIPKSGTAKTASYTLETTDVGELIEVDTSGAIVIPDATFSTGDVVLIFNNTSSDITLTCSITTAFIGGTNVNSSTITLATRGICNVLFISDTVCVVTGNVT